MSASDLGPVVTISSREVNTTDKETPMETTVKKKTKNLIRWISKCSGQAGEGGYWNSVEGRFSISPNYRHTVFPDSYTVTDELVHSYHSEEYRKNAKQNFDRVRDCKDWAERRLRAEHERNA